MPKKQIDPPIDHDEEQVETTVVDNKAPTREAWLALQDEFLDLVGDDSQEAFNRRTRIRQLLKKLGPHAGCGDEQMVEIDIPLSVTNEPFKINQKIFHGKCMVPECEARQLAYMIHKNLQVDRDRFRGQQKTLPGFEIHAKTIG